MSTKEIHMPLQCVDSKLGSVTLHKKHRDSPFNRSYLLQKVDPRGGPRSVERSYIEVPLSS